MINILQLLEARRNRCMFRARCNYERRQLVRMTVACHLLIEPWGCPGALVTGSRSSVVESPTSRALMQGDSAQHQPHPAATNVPERRAGSLLSQMLRAEICSRSTLSFLMEAHDAPSGAIAKCAGFKGLWASGLSIASSLGYAMPTRLPCTSLTS